MGSVFTTSYSAPHSSQRMISPSSTSSSTNDNVFSHSGQTDMGTPWNLCSRYRMLIACTERCIEASFSENHPLRQAYSFDAGKIAVVGRKTIHENFEPGLFAFSVFNVSVDSLRRRVGADRQSQLWQSGCPRPGGPADSGSHTADFRAAHPAGHRQAGKFSQSQHAL